MRRLARYPPVLEWGRNHDRGDLGGDLVAAVIVTIMLIPQSLAYALLAGRINRELGGDFEPGYFGHEAPWKPAALQLNDLLDGFQLECELQRLACH